MKKLIAILMALALMTCGLATFALAEEADINININDKFNTLIEDGEFIIQVDAEGQEGWIADDLAQDPTVLELAYADTLEDTFVARYSPVGDGDMTVGVRHYTGIACDEMMAWDVHVENGAVQEVTNGMYLATLDDEEIDPMVLGDWLEKDTQFTQMTFEKNPERGWDVEIAAPMTHGAYIFKTTVQYDCELDSFVYDKGKFWNTPITDSEEEVDLGEAAVAGTTGSITFTGEEGNMTAEWYDDNNPEMTVIFERADGEAAEAAEAEEAETEAAEAEANEGIYEDPHGDLSFNCDPGLFEIASDEDADDLHTVALKGIREDLGEYGITFAMRELQDGEAAPDLENPGDFIEDGAEATQGEWNGFENVIMYASETDDTLRQVFVVPVKDDDDGEVEDVLTITITAQKLADEEAGMAQSDAISNVLDSLVVDD